MKRPFLRATALVVAVFLAGAASWVFVPWPNCDGSAAPIRAGALDTGLSLDWPR